MKLKNRKIVYAERSKKNPMSGWKEVLIGRGTMQFSGVVEIFSTVTGVVVCRISTFMEIPQTKPLRSVCFS
jgi:hypothetical protein